MTQTLLGRCGGRAPTTTGEARRPAHALLITVNASRCPPQTDDLLAKTAANKALNGELPHAARGGRAAHLLGHAPCWPTAPAL